MATRTYRKPMAFTRAFGKTISIIGLGTTLSVRGRKSGQNRNVLVTPIEVDGGRYLVSPRGETDWVRNLRAASEGSLTKWWKKTPIRVTEVDGETRAKVVEAYRKQLGAAVAAHFRDLPNPEDHPIFLIQPK